jgi:hypothetical protein
MEPGSSMWTSGTRACLLSRGTSPVTFMMHNFWAVGAEMKAAEMINFLKNFALLGSALMFLALKKPWPLSLGGEKKAS